MCIKILPRGGLTLSIAMLSARNVVLTWTPATCGELPKAYPTWGQCCGWTSPCHYWDCRMLLSNSCAGTLR